MWGTWSLERGKAVWEPGAGDGGHLEPGTMNQMHY